MRHSFKISTKIWLSLSILIFGYFISMLFGFIFGQQSETRLHIVSEYLFPAAKQSQMALVAFREQIRQYNDAVMLGEQSFIESAEVKGAEVDRALKAIARMKGIQAQKKASIQELQKQLNVFNRSALAVYSRLSAFLDYLSEIHAEDAFKARDKLENKAIELAGQTKDLEASLIMLSETFSDELKKELAEISDTTRRQRYLNLVVFFAVVLSALSLIAIIISRSITRPLEKTFMLESAVEQSVDGISVSDWEGRVQFVNRAWAVMHGYDPHELLGRDLRCCHNEEQVRTELEPFIEQVKSRGAQKGEMGHVRKDGSIFISMLTMTTLKDDDEKGMRIVSIARDISALKKNERELRKAKESAEEANRALQESLEIIQQTQDQLVQSEKMASLGGLVAGVAHEINTPVGVGVTASSFLEEKTREYMKRLGDNNLKRSDLERYMNVASEASSIILKNLDRAADLIRGFKQVAVDQSGEARRKFFVKEYLDELLVSLRPNYRRTGHSVEVNCPGDLEIDSYPGVFSQVITNLLMNTLTHAFDGVEKGIISIDIEVREQMLFLEYSDNGKGMSPETLKKIFDPFYTTRRAQGGTGLGMHIVYNLVTRTLNGQITCQSSPGKGSTFFIRVPIA